MGLRPDETILVIVCDRQSSMLGTLLWLFGIDHVGNTFALRQEKALAEVIIIPAMHHAAHFDSAWH